MSLVKGQTAQTAVFWREAMRNARRWQTYALRMGFSAFVMAVLLLSWAQMFEVFVDQSAYARLGRQLFETYVALQITLAAVLAPLLVAQGIAEERETGTLDILCITRLTPLQVLLGKIAGALLVLWTVILGGTPVLALVATLGGVSWLDVAWATLHTSLVAAVLGAVGGFVALNARGVVVPVATSVVYGVLFMVALPASGGALPLTAGRAVNQCAPLVVLGGGGGWGLQPLLVWVPVGLAVIAMMVPVFQMRLTDDNQGADWGVLSLSVWVLEKYRRRIRWLVVATIGTWALLVLLSGGRLLPDPVLLVVGTAWAVLVTVTASGWFLDGVLQVSHLWTESHIGGVDPELMAAAGLRRARWMAFRQQVWSNPVAWREWCTEAVGPVSRVMAVALGVWIMVAVLSGGLLDEELRVFLGWTGIGLGAVGTAVLATGTMLEERRAQSLELLFLAGLSSRTVLVGKLTAVAGRTLPAVGMGTLLVGMDALLRGQLAQTGLALGWSGALWTAGCLVCIAVAARSVPGRMAWGINLLCAGLGVGLLWQAPTLAESLPVLQPIVDLTRPGVGDEGGISLATSGAALGVTWLAMGLGGALLGYRLPRWAALRSL